jgi:transposase
MKIIRQCVGIDCSKDTLDVAINFLDENFQTKIHSTEIFKNNNKGFKNLMKWMRKLCLKDLPYQVVVEATGVYHELLAYTLVNNGFTISIVLPNKIRNYCRSTDIRTITDKISAKQISEFGLMKKLDNWVMPDKIYLQLRELSRERIQLLEEKTAVLNQLHAHKHSAFKSNNTIKRFEERIKFIEKQIKHIEKNMKEQVNENPELKNKINNICKVKGLGFITVVTIIAETNGFNLIKNSRQLVCYAGYDVVVKESGTSVKSKARISHKGNKYIRRAMHFPAITAVKYNNHLQNMFIRIYNKSNIKMKGYVAAQRKMLILIYTLWKKNELYNPNHIHKSLIKLEQPEKTALTELELVRS